MRCIAVLRSVDMSFRVRGRSELETVAVRRPRAGLKGKR